MERKFHLRYQKRHVYALLLLIEDANNQEHIDQLIKIKQFLLTYNGISNVNPPLGHDIDKFVPSQTVAVLFSVHLLNFQTSKDSKSKFKYIFHMVSIYFVQLAERHNFLMLSRRKCGSDK